MEDSANRRVAPSAPARRCAGAALLRRVAVAVAIVLAAGATGAATAASKDAPRCTPPMLWGDGQHDDTKALNAWLEGRTVVWAQTEEPVGPQIAGRRFRLSAAIYVPSGTGREIRRFEMVWPAIREMLSGVSIAAGRDPDKPPVVTGLRKTGGDPGEGIPFEGPDPALQHRPPARCFIS